MPPTTTKELKAAQQLAYRTKEPIWWCNLGAHYATLDPPDFARARKWYAKAAAAGDTDAKFELGAMLVHGEGGVTDLKRGRRLLEAAAREGQISALKMVEHGYQVGAWGFPHSPQRARFFKRQLEQLLSEPRTADE
jgi:TPR repeat protein